MPFQVPPPGRAHARLTLVITPEPDSPRAALFLRATLIRAWLLWVALVALLGAAVAMIPLAWRRAPVGRRLHHPRRPARVIPLPPARRAAPR